ncbi:hypothetical protein CTEN210_12921 [Chaetoceros tenuissimus]|uniref:RING-type domain-containing protein n=1 Tax=Chaetoceros tenuissimus TaxID=426638 RepID=A0AAD3D4A8_9STRA|nr:hypothetical protein CTEN210_12921 [Chaetoceros tenuissimus]
MTNLCGVDDVAVANCSEREEVMYFILIIVSLVSSIVLLRRCVCMVEDSTEIAIRSSPSPSALPMGNDDSVGNRHILVLTSIIHKKVITATDDEKDGDQKTNLQNDSKILKSSNKALSSHPDEVDEESLQRVTKLTIGKTDMTIEEISRSKSSKNLNFEVFQDDNVLSSRKDTLYNPRMCPICCEEYEKGHDIAWSKNEECVHAFHTDCIVPWLLEHSDCPMCRNDYLCMEKV